MKVFISHASEDKDLARTLSRFLRDAGLEVWSDEDIMPGDNWAQKVSQALNASEAMVVLVSTAALNSDLVRREIEFALGTEAYRKRLVPVFVGSRDTIPQDRLPWILRRLNGVELTDPTKEENLQQIVHTLSTIH